jgi:hypothetical protein
MLLLPAVIKLRLDISWLTAGSCRSADALYARKHPLNGLYGASHFRFTDDFKRIPKYQLVVHRLQVK